MKTPPIAEKTEESGALGPPSGQTPASLEAGRPVSEREAEDEVTNYLQGWPLHVVTLASVSTVVLDADQPADACVC